MSAGGSTKTQPGMGGQTAGRPMTPFSPDGGAQMGGMQGFNTGMGMPSQGGMGLGGIPSGPVKSMAGMDRQAQQGPMPQMQMGNLGQMASMIQGGGQMPQAMMPFQQSQGQIPQALTPFSMANMDRQAQQGPMPQMQFPQAMMPFQQSQGMAPQPPATQSPMQQGLGGLGAYMGGGG